MAKGVPWNRQPGETTKAYSAFVHYLKLGTERSVSKALRSADKLPTNRRHWQRWASKYRWADRAAAYDTDHLESQINERHTKREAVRQKWIDDLQDMQHELRNLSRGIMRPGDQQIVTDRDGKPRTVQMELPDGTIAEVAVTRELVPPKVRADILIKQIGYCGIVEPHKSEIDIGTNKLGEQLREGLKDMDPAFLEGLAKLCGVIPDDAG